MSDQTKRSKLIDNRIKVSGTVVEAARTHGPGVAKILAGQALEVQGPNTKMTKEAYEALFTVLGDELAAAAAAVDKAEQDCVAERSDDVGLREKRDELEADLYNRMMRVKSAVTDGLGEAGLKTYGLTGGTPRGAREIVTHALNVADLMKRKPVTFDLDGLTFDSAALVKALDARAAALTTAVNDLTREERELEAVIGQRDRVVARWSDVYQGVANTLVGLFRLAGRADLAERVRPTSRTVSGEDAGEEAKGGEEPKGGNGNG